MDASPSAGPPAIVSLSPNAGAGTSVTFKAVYSDPNGAGDLNELQLQVNTIQTSANACFVYYQPQGNHLYLYNNTGTALLTPALTLGVAGTVSNSQCTLNAGFEFSHHRRQRLDPELSRSASTALLWTRATCIFTPPGSADRTAAGSKKVRGRRTQRRASGDRVTLAERGHRNVGHVQGSLFGSQWRGRSDRTAAAGQRQQTGTNRASSITSRRETISISPTTPAHG